MSAIGGAGEDKEVLQKVFQKRSTDFVEPEQIWEKLVAWDAGSGRHKLFFFTLCCAHCF